MYQDKESIKVFEHMHARDALKDFAHRDDEDADADVWSGHCREEGEEAPLSLAISAVALVAIAALIFFTVI